MIKQSKAFVRKVSYSYGISLIDEVSQASSATCWYGIKQVLELIAQADQLSIRAIQNDVCFILDIIKSTSVTDSLFIRDSLIVTLNLHLKLVTRKTPGPTDLKTKRGDHFLCSYWAHIEDGL